MNYSELYFGCPIEELNYGQIENYFLEARDESDKIEFKAYHSAEEGSDSEKEKSIIRTVAGMLNSEGGLIIWGAPVGKLVPGKKEKTFQGELSPLQRFYEKDSFINKLADQITPSPKGIRFQGLKKDQSYVYVIEIDPSDYSPHQFRNLYPMRLDGQTKTAPHHYIEALFKRIRFPRLEGYIKFEKFDRYGTDKYILSLNLLIFNISRLQNEHELYIRLITHPGMIKSYYPGGSNIRHYTPAKDEVSLVNAKSVLYHGEPYSFDESIIYTEKELVEVDWKPELLLYFGGKHSPLMVSDYTLHLTEVTPKDINSIIQVKKENRFSYELRDGIDKTDAEIMKIHLGR